MQNRTKKTIIVSQNSPLGKIIHIFFQKNTGNIDFVAFLHYNNIDRNKGDAHGKYERFFEYVLSTLDLQ